MFYTRSFLATKWSNLFNGTNFVRRVLSHKFCHAFSFFFPWICNWFAQCLHTCVSSLNPTNMLHLQVMVLLTLSIHLMWFLRSFHNTFFIARRLLLMSGSSAGVHAWFVKKMDTVLASFSAHTTVLMLSFLDQKLGCLSMTSLPSRFNMLVASPFLVCVVQIRLNLYTGGSARRHDPRCSRCQRNHPCRSRHLRRMITPNFPAASTCIICSTLSAICCQILVRIYNNVFKCLLYIE